MKDIETRTDLEILLRQFYKGLLADDSINFIFIDVAKMDLEDHLHVITDFWELSLFHTGNYRNNPMKIHMDLNQKEKLTAAHFATWLRHFEATVDSLFAGPNAEKIKTRAQSIATVMQIKLSGY